MYKQILLVLLCSLLLCLSFSCQKDLTAESNTTITGSTGSIGNFSVTVLNRYQTQDSIRWTKPTSPVGTVLKYKIYLSNTLIAQNLTDTIFNVTNLSANLNYVGRVVAYTSAADSSFTSFNLPVFTAPVNPYSYLNGYYKVTEREYDFNNTPDSNNLIFTGRIMAGTDSIITFYQYTRTPKTWWGYNFNSKVWNSLNDSLYNPGGNSVSGRILNANTIRLNYAYGNSTTVFFVNQKWERLQNVSDSSLYAYQFPTSDQGLIKTFAGNEVSSTQSPPGNGGLAVNASLSSVRNIFIDPQQNAYISCNFTSSVRKVNAAGIITAFAGNNTDGFSGDGGPAVNAQLNIPTGTVTDTNGNVYISELANRRIRKVNTSGIISTFAGTGQFGYSGDGGLAVITDIGAPQDLTYGPGGHIYFITGSRICKIDINTNIITTIAGNGIAGYSGDGGQATFAKISSPAGMTFDASGNLYIADKDNYVIRKVTPNGIISTIAGVAGQPSSVYTDGIAATASKMYVQDVALDANGNLYISTGSRVIKVNTAGLVYRFAGFGTANTNTFAMYSIGPEFYNGDNRPALLSAFPVNYGMYCDGTTLYIAGYKRIRKILL